MIAAWVLTLYFFTTPLIFKGGNVAQDYYVAYPISEELSLNLDQFIQQMKAPKPKKAPELLVSVLALNNDAALDAFLLDLLSSAGLKGKEIKRIEMGVASVKKARSVVALLVKKLDVKKSITIAEHFEIGRLKLQIDGFVEGESKSEAEFMAAPISHDCYQRVLDENNILRTQCAHSVRGASFQEELEHSRGAFISNLKELVGLSMEFFNYGLLDAIGTGPILKRTVRLAMNTSLKLAYSTYDNVFSQANEEEMLKAMEHFEKMLIMRS